MSAALFRTLIVAPDVSVARIDAVLTGLGFGRSDSGLAAPPILEGEPELAAWAVDGSKPRVVYTFNPVAFLRVLDVATVPPAGRRAIAEQLPLLATADITERLAASEPRDRLLGVWAAQECELLELVPQLKLLGNDREQAVADQSQAVAHRLQQIGQSRLDVITSLQSLQETARPVLARLDDPRAVEELRPGRDDCVQLFDEELAEGILAGVEEFYDGRLRAAGGGSAKITATTAGLLRWPNELSQQFPLGYQDIAGWMVPERMWVTWVTVSSNGGAGTRYDGLAWVEDHWVWLPKVFRIVKRLVSGGAGS